MTDPHASHDPRREAARPSWYGSEAGAGSSGTGSSAAGWPDAPTGDADRAATMGTAGLERAKNEFSWSTIAQDTVEIYKGLM